MALLLALLAAGAFALGSVLQQKGTLETSAGERDPHFLAELWHHPVWVAGGVSQATGWILQAAALDRGALLVVQSVCSLSLVIALPLGIWLTNQVVTNRAWMGAAMVVVGIVLVLSVGSPQTGSSKADSTDWLTAAAITVASVTLLVVPARSRHGSVRALLLGSAAGVCFALQAAVTKVFVPLVGHGLPTILSSWTTYALIGTALAGFVLQQSALKVGVLAPAIASSNVVTLVGSVVFGITVFGESLSKGGDRAVPSVVGLILAVVGIGLLAGSDAPATRPGSITKGDSRRGRTGPRARSRGPHRSAPAPDGAAEGGG
jgi:drug/metabolite transporter (DMT)-like permease